MEVIPSPFSLAQLTVTKHSWCNHGNEGMWFTVEQKGHKKVVGLECVVRLCNHGNQGMLFTVEQK
jgi:hypothetical protein